MQLTLRAAAPPAAARAALQQRPGCGTGKATVVALRHQHDRRGNSAWLGTPEWEPLGTPEWEPPPCASAPSACKHDNPLQGHRMGWRYRWSMHPSAQANLGLQYPGEFFPSHGPLLGHAPETQAPAQVQLTMRQASTVSAPDAAPPPQTPGWGCHRHTPGSCQTPPWTKTGTTGAAYHVAPCLCAPPPHALPA